MMSSGHSNSIDAFLILIRAGLFGRTEEAERLQQESVDWAEVYRLAKEQRVVGLAAEGVENLQEEWSKSHNTPLVPKEWVRKLASVTLMLEQNNLGMNSFIVKLASELRKKDIKTILLKGQGVALCYNKPLWRTCGDVDLLLSPDDYQKAKEFLLPTAAYAEPENVYKKHLEMVLGKWLVELHGSLRCSFSFRVDKELDKMCSHTLSGGCMELLSRNEVRIFTLEKENHVLYVFAHFMNHFYKGGVGIKQICDWSRMLWTFRDSLDLNYLGSRLNDMGLRSEWKAFGAYAVEYLGMPEQAMPFYADEEKWRRKAGQINSFVMRAGNLGYNRQRRKKEVSFLSRKLKSSMQRICDLGHHLSIFPLDTLRFFPSILLNGIHQE